MGGMADMRCLLDCLDAIDHGLASTQILERYEEQRRQKYHMVTDVASKSNLKRLRLPGNDASMLDAGLHRLEQASRDLATAKAYLEVSLPRVRREPRSNRVRTGSEQSHSGHDPILRPQAKASEWHCQV